MDSRNNRGQSEKQRDLVNRLEEIRQKRNAAEGTNTSETPKRNEGQQQRRPVRGTRRNANQQRRSTTKRQVDTGQFSQPTYKQRPMIEERESIGSSTIKDINQVSEITETGQKPSAKQISSKNAKSVINKLSDGNSLAESIIINEVLSKPIALKKRYR